MIVEDRKLIVKAIKKAGDVSIVTVRSEINIPVSKKNAIELIEDDRLGIWFAAYVFDDNPDGRVSVVIDRNDNVY